VRVFMNIFPWEEALVTSGYWTNGNISTISTNHNLKAMMWMAYFLSSFECIQQSMDLTQSAII